MLMIRDALDLEDELTHNAADRDSITPGDWAVLRGIWSGRAQAQEVKLKEAEQKRLADQARANARRR